MWMAGVWEALGTGICAVLRGVSGVLALTVGGLGVGPMEGRGGGGCSVGGHLRKDHPQPLGTGSKHGVGQPTFQRLGIRGRWGTHTGAPPLPLLRVVCHSARRQLAAEKLVWEGVPALGSSGSLAVLGSTRPWLPWGLFAWGGKATEGFCQLWAGAGSRELLSWLRSVAWGGPVGLLRSG